MAINSAAAAGRGLIKALHAASRRETERLSGTCKPELSLKTPKNVLHFKRVLTSPSKCKAAFAERHMAGRVTAFTSSAAEPGSAQSKGQIGLLRDFVFVWSFYHGTFAAPPNVSVVFGQPRGGEQRGADVLIPVVDHTLWAGQQRVGKLPSSEMVRDPDETQVGLQMFSQNSINVPRITRPHISHATLGNNNLTCSNVWNVSYIQNDFMSNW